ncbi:MAG TPA: hypothetical protein VGI40_00975 [Pirellulaceae bacterium]|jgi:hypothetical protein
MEPSLRLFPTADIGAFVANGSVVAFNVGPEEKFYFVVAHEPLDYRIERPSGSTFAKINPEQPQNYRVVVLSGDRADLDVDVRNEPFNIHDVQPLSSSGLLLVCGRSRFRGTDDFDRNGRIYSRDGRFAHEISLGDGIQSVQATSNAVIWTSYFDEGVFGNYGWESPIGSAGLVAWDSSGRKLYEFVPPNKLESICDCYALNVESDAVAWCYYYTQFPLVRIRTFEVDGVWNVPIHGSDAFAVSGDLALFRGAYKQRDTYNLIALQSEGKATIKAQLHLRDEFGEVLIAERVVGRGNSIYLLRGTRIYRLNVERVANFVREKND